MPARQHSQAFRHLGVRRRKAPCDDRAPVVARDVSLLPSESSDDSGHVFDQVLHAIGLDPVRRVAHAIAPHVRRYGERAGLGQRSDLTRPRLRTLGEAVKEDGGLAAGRSVHHGSKAEAVGLDHVLARGHLTSSSMNRAATSSAWSSTARRPWPWPLNTSRRASGIALIDVLKSSSRANGSRSPLKKRVGHLMRGKCAVRSWSGKPGRCSGYEKRTSPPKSASTAAMLATLPPKDWPPPITS